MMEYCVSTTFKVIKAVMNMGYDLREEAWLRLARCLDRGWNEGTAILHQITK
jgi:hypothetical protein